jgi:hypothetical protein
MGWGFKTLGRLAVDFGFTCDGSNPLEDQRKEWRRQQYLKLKAEFEP